jgi:2-dehydro-3-deoxyphosphogluconate aldolase/(4S)-4-hydroxy-2-oxoglutarate aldolase
MPHGSDFTLARMAERRVATIVRSNDQLKAREAIRAVVAGGFRMVEFTLTTPGALELVSEFAGNRELLVGAGTVMTSAQARAAVAAGAAFIVSPNLDPDVVAEGLRQGVVVVPGTYTPTEMVRAARLGAQVVKLFPAPHDIPLFLRQVLGPLPDLRIFPTAGVTPDNFEAILAAGAFGVGFVSSLLPPDEMARGDWAAIERRAASIISRMSK